MLNKTEISIEFFFIIFRIFRYNIENVQLLSVAIGQSFRYNKYYT